MKTREIFLSMVDLEIDRDERERAAMARFAAELVGPPSRYEYFAQWGHGPIQAPADRVCDVTGRKFSGWGERSDIGQRIYEQDHREARAYSGQFGSSWRSR